MPRQSPRHVAQRFAPALLLPLVLLFIALLPAGVQADPIVLTGGEIIVDRPNRIARVNLTGLNFSVNFSIDTQFGGNFPAATFRTSTFNCGCDGFGRATFDNLTTIHFTGGGIYDASTISGSISLYSSVPGSPTFSLTYVGTGFLASDGPVTRFVITNAPAAVPEPATLLLLGTGLAGVAVRARKRRRRQADAESPPG